MHFSLHRTSLWALVRRFCGCRKGGTGGGGWGHPQGAVHMAATRLGCKRAMVTTEWANSHPGCMNRHRQQGCSAVFPPLRTHLVLHTTPFTKWGSSGQTTTIKSLPKQNVAITNQMHGFCRWYPFIRTQQQDRFTHALQ